MVLATLLTLLPTLPARRLWLSGQEVPLPLRIHVTVGCVGWALPAGGVGWVRVTRPELPYTSKGERRA